MWFNALISMLAGVKLKALWVIFLFLPSMAVRAPVLVRTSIFIVINMVL
jgi:hypothetical protein